MDGTRSILITGCSSGIGEAAARTMKKRGWRVFATARKPEDVARLAGEGLEAIALDYGDGDSIKACADHVLEATEGRLFAVFHNGAYGQPGAIEDLKPDVLRTQFEANFFGWHDLTHRLLPPMRRNARGRIVLCSSVLGLVPLPFRGAYVASKYALEGWGETLALELAGSGIRVSLIEPGPIRTKFDVNARAAFHANVDMEASRHRHVYAARLAASQEDGPATRFRLEADDVVDKLIDAVERDRPKLRYFVTTPTYLLDGLKRVLPSRTMHRVLKQIGRAENRAAKRT